MKALLNEHKYPKENRDNAVNDILRQYEVRSKDDE
jgi:hypothetical protein